MGVALCVCESSRGVVRRRQVAGLSDLCSGDKHAQELDMHVGFIYPSDY